MNEWSKVKTSRKGRVGKKRGGVLSVDKYICKILRLKKKYPTGDEISDQVWKKPCKKIIYSKTPQREMVALLIDSPSVER